MASTKWFLILFAFLLEKDLNQKCMYMALWLLMNNQIRLWRRSDAFCFTHGWSPVFNNATSNLLISQIINKMHLNIMTNVQNWEQFVSSHIRRLVSSNLIMLAYAVLFLVWNLDRSRRVPKSQTSNPTYSFRSEAPHFSIGPITTIQNNLSYWAIIINITYLY